MSIDEQKNKAWREYLERYGDEAASNCQDVFDEGYLAALRKLFVEVKPEDLVNGKMYWCLVFSDYLDSETWIEMSFHGNSWWYDFEGFGFEADEVKRVLERANLPSPSDIFGRGE